MRSKAKWVFGIGLSLLGAQMSFGAGFLFTGADTEEFGGTAPPDRLGRYKTVGPIVVSGLVIPVDFTVNGLDDGGSGTIIGGDPFSSNIKNFDYNGVPISSTPSGIPPGGTVREDYAYNGTDLYRAQFDAGIYKLDRASGAVLDFKAQVDVVGMAYAESRLWITHWAGRKVGTWDPASNIFIPVFDTPENAGGLAYDSQDKVLWVGMRGGSVTPYSLAGTALGPSFLPFGAMPDTIDGLAFAVPEPSSLLCLGVAVLALGARRRRA